MLTKAQTRAHYNNEKVMNTIIRVSTDGIYSRAAMKAIPDAYIDQKTGKPKDVSDWYKGTGSYKKRKTLCKIDLSSKQDYVNAVGSCRTLYWTLNVFNKEIYSVDYTLVDHDQSKLLSLSHTRGYMLGIDIDADHCDIHDPDVKKAVEDMGQFFSDKLREYAPNSVYALYSGRGIYILLHHKVFDSYFENFQSAEEWNDRLDTLFKAYNTFINTLKIEFFKLHPEHEGKTKPDALNGAQRVFKTIFSIHKSLDCAVIPLDPANIKIDFDRAAIPLKPDVISTGDNWYTQYDSDVDLVETLLKPYFKVASKKVRQASVSNKVYGDIPVSEVPLDEIEKWPPCMRNLYNLPSCGEGQTRGLAAFAAFLGQIGIEEEKARSMFNELVLRWNAREENIFRDYFGRMKVPGCAKLGSNDNTGFPVGKSIKILNVCVPDERCMDVPSPRYYVDIEANRARLLIRIPRKNAGKTPA